MKIQDETPKAGADLPHKVKANNKRWWLLGGAIVIIIALAAIFTAFRIAGGVTAYNAKEAAEERVEWFEDRFYELNSASQNHRGYPASEDFEDECKRDRIVGLRLNEPFSSPYCSVQDLISPGPNAYTIIVNRASLKFEGAQLLAETTCKAIEGKESYGVPIIAGEEYALTVMDKLTGFKYYEGTCGAEDMKLMKASTVENPVIKSGKS